MKLRTDLPAREERWAWLKEIPAVVRHMILILSASASLVALGAAWTLKAQGVSALFGRVSNLEEGQRRTNAFEDTIRMRIKARELTDSAEARDRRRMLCLLGGVADAVQDRSRTPNPITCER